MDAGFFAGQIARECLFRGVEFAIGARRNPVIWRAAATIGGHEWVPAIGMDHGEVAVCDYVPDWWPADTACLVRRVRIPVELVSADPRARRRRTIPADQLTLALEGKLDHVYGYSFILTTMDVSTEERIAEVEWWYRRRTDIEALNRDAKHGAALRHMPSGDQAVNTVWMWAALLATTGHFPLPYSGKQHPNMIIYLADDHHSRYSRIWVRTGSEPTTDLSNDHVQLDDNREYLASRQVKRIFDQHEPACRQCSTLRPNGGCGAVLRSATVAVALG